jgi:hypothetical protein
MPSPLPLITRREIVREYRPDGKVTVDSAIRTLRSKKALSSGFSIPTRGVGGALDGRVYLYSALNRDAARAIRHGDTKTAVRIGKAAAKHERSPAAKHVAAALAADSASLAAAAGLGGTAALASALSAPALTAWVADLQKMMSTVRYDMKLTADSTVLNGRIASFVPSGAILNFRDALPFTVPTAILDAAQLNSIGAPVSAMWEILPEGRSLLTVEPAIDTPDVEDSHFDIHGTPWGQVLTGDDRDALEVTGTPSVTIPRGIPDVA